jgi:DNA-binding Lrp family transcriptional regulator
MIIMDLLKNCRQSYQAIAKKHSVTMNAIKKRVQKLLDSGVIEFCVEPNVGMMDGDWVLAFLSTTGTEDQAEFIAKLGQNQMINEVGTVSGARYIIYAVCRGLEELSQFNKFLRSLEPVKDIEVHPLLMTRGSKIELSNQEIKILHCIVDEPRMRLSKIAECAGYSAKTIRRALNNLIEGDSIWFGARLRLNDADSLTFLAKIEWDEQQMALPDILGWLSTEFPEYWVPAISATEPIIFAAFLVKSVKEIAPIVERVKSARFVKSVISIMGGESHSFSDMRRYWLEEKFLEYGLDPILER